jgi:cysteinyl-tRNA synthetase, unknown class
MTRAALCALALLLPACNLLALNSAATSTLNGSTSPSSSSTASPLLTGLTTLSTPCCFAIVLQNVGQNGAVDDTNITQISQSHFDLVTLDDVTTWNSGATTKLPESSIVTQMHNTPGQTLARKLVLAYIDVGEAESSRNYWQSSWTVGNPTFILGPDPNQSPYGFSGKYAVNFTDQRWQAILFGSPTALVDQAMTDGFDGVFLDNLGTFVYPIVFNADHNAATDMVTLVAAISAYAKGKKPNFLVIGCGGSGLTADSRYASAVDGDAETGIFYTSSTSQLGDVQQDPAVKATLEVLLQRVQAANKAVISIDFASSISNAQFAYAGGAANHYIEYVTTSDLSKLTTNLPPTLTPSAKARRVN